MEFVDWMLRVAAVVWAAMIIETASVVNASPDKATFSRVTLDK